MEQIKESLKQFKAEFELSNGRQKGLQIPRDGSKSFWTLYYLWRNKNTIISKREAEAFVSQVMKKSVADLQELRHLGKQRGFDILQGGNFYKGVLLKRGQYVFRGFEGINSYYDNYKDRRKEKDLDFETLKQCWKYCCATCGSQEGKPQRYTGHITVLEKGHKNPDKPMSQDNILPQCSYCNQKFKDKFIFDEQGQPKEYSNSYKKREGENK